MMKVDKIRQEDRGKVDAFIVRQWFSMQMAVHGELIDMGTADGWYATDGDEIIGLITYRIVNDEMEILSLDSVHKKRGVGTVLLNETIDKAKDCRCKRIKVITTNDNLDALRFYQKHGFELVKIHRNAVDVARKTKPSIPLIGNDGIPLKHEIVLEYSLRTIES